MSEPIPKTVTRRGVRATSTKPPSLPDILCSRCHSPILVGQHVQPLFSARLARWPEHPVLSKPLAIRGIIPADGQPAGVDMSLGDQLRQRAAMGAEKERAELAAFEELLSKCIADAVVAELQQEAEAVQKRAAAAG